MVLWDFVEFYDTIRYDVLRRECDSNNYGRRKTAMSMMVHVAPRKLKMGKAVSRNTRSVGRGIVAGCKRSQSMAKAYTNRSVDKLRRSFIVFVHGKNTKYEHTPKKESGSYEEGAVQRWHKGVPTCGRSHADHVGQK